MSKIGIKGTRGFSMVELSVVLGLMAIAAAIAIPMLASSMRGMQLISDTRSISTTMTYAKMSAISQLTHYRVSFDLNDNEWQLEKWNRDDEEFELQQATNGLSRGMAGSGIAFRISSDTAPAGFPTTSSTAITFNSRGIPDGVHIVYLSNEDDDYAVSASLSGKVQIWRRRNGQWVSQ
jgi:prepilin-type N-terminal cleavage/methylation domain-containing protein